MAHFTTSDVCYHDFIPVDRSFPSSSTEEPCITSPAYMNTPMEMFWSTERHVCSIPVDSLIARYSDS
jgi:hypothetical protein